MKQIVIDHKIKAFESGFNQKFMDFAKYYGIMMRLCYPKKLETKGKVEKTIKYLRYTLWTGDPLILSKASMPNAWSG
jgi:transposase